MNLWVSLHEPELSELDDPAYERALATFEARLGSNENGEPQIQMVNTREISFKVFERHEKQKVSLIGLWSEQTGGTKFLESQLTMDQVFHRGDRAVFFRRSIKIDLAP